MGPMETVFAEKVTFQELGGFAGLCVEEPVGQPISVPMSLSNASLSSAIRDVRVKAVDSSQR
jgi:hypothetical protein